MTFIQARETELLLSEIACLKDELSSTQRQLSSARMGWDAVRRLLSEERARKEELKTKYCNDLLASEREANSILTEEVELLRNGLNGDYDLDAWLDWAKESYRLRSENKLLKAEAEYLRTAVQILT